MFVENHSMWLGREAFSFLSTLQRFLEREFPVMSRDLISKADVPTVRKFLSLNRKKVVRPTGGLRSCLHMTIWPRDGPSAAANAVGAAEDYEMSAWTFAIASACGFWYFFILVVQAIGFTQL